MGQPRNAAACFLLASPSLLIITTNIPLFLFMMLVVTKCWVKPIDNA